MTENHLPTLRPSVTSGLLLLLGVTAANWLAGVLVAVLDTLGVQLAPQIYLITAVAEIVIFGLPVVWMYQKMPALLPCLRLRRVGVGVMVYTALAAVLGVFALQVVTIFWAALLEWLGLMVMEQSFPMPQNGAGVLVMVLALAAAPAVCEELLFRGFLLPSQESLGTRRAALLTGLLFALVHANLTGLPAMLAIGVLLAVLAMATRSIFVPMLYHLVHNITTLFLSIGAERMLEGLVETAQGATGAIIPDAGTLGALVAMLLLFGGAWALTLRSVFRAQAREDRTLGFPPWQRPAQARLRRGEYALLAVTIGCLALLCVLTYVSV